jgi:hypothetical protein
VRLASASAARASWRIERRGRVVARGSGLTARRRRPAGRYTMTVVLRNRRGAKIAVLRQRLRV